MGEGTQHSCALGGFSDNGTGVLVQEKSATEDQTLQGRYVYTTFKTTDQLLDFIAEVLEHIQATAKYVHVFRDGDHRVFLVHNIAANEDPETAWRLFTNTFKQMLSELQWKNSEFFYEIKTGKASVPMRTSVPSLPDPVLNALAVNSNPGMHGNKRD